MKLFLENMDLYTDYDDNTVTLDDLMSAVKRMCSDTSRLDFDAVSVYVSGKEFEQLKHYCKNFDSDSIKAIVSMPDSVDQGDIFGSLHYPLSCEGTIVPGPNGTILYFLAIDDEEY